MYVSCIYSHFIVYHYSTVGSVVLALLYFRSKMLHVVLCKFSEVFFPLWFPDLSHRTLPLLVLWTLPLLVLWSSTVFVSFFARNNRAPGPNSFSRLSLSNFLRCLIFSQCSHPPSVYSVLFRSLLSGLDFTLVELLVVLHIEMCWLTYYDLLHSPLSWSPIRTRHHLCG